MNIYKIRRKSDGKYSSGGVRPRFTKAGKIWIDIREIKKHLTYMKEWVGYDKTLPFPYEDCEIVVASVDFEPSAYEITSKFEVQFRAFEFD
jgi:hypothetical protein